MNMENVPSFTSSNVGNIFSISSADSPGYFYGSESHQVAQQQQHEVTDDDQPQQQSSHQLEQLPYHLSSTSSSPLFRFGHGSLHGISSPALARALSTLGADKCRRPRGEKKSIPDEQKDDKYYERRRRNNEAAKKSRDGRKAREDELAIRASFLEKDNSILKVQVRSMREEAMKLRELWVAKCQGMAMSRHMQQNQQQGQNIMQNPTQTKSSLGQQGRAS